MLFPKGGNEEVFIEGKKIKVGGDVIMAINDFQIINTDVFSAYLEEFTVPGQKITLTIVRNNEVMDLIVEVGARPRPNSLSA